MLAVFLLLNPSSRNGVQKWGAPIVNQHRGCKPSVTEVISIPGAHPSNRESICIIAACRPQSPNRKNRPPRDSGFTNHDF